MLQAQDKIPEAESLFREALQRRRQILPADHPDFVTDLHGLSALLLIKKLATESEPLLRASVAIGHKAYSPGDWRIAASESELGRCLTQLGRFDEAERLLLASHESLKTAQNAPPKVQAKAREYLVHLYQAWGKPDEAAKWQKPPPPAPPATAPAVSTLATERGPTRSE